MASLSNINGLFDVHSTGAILFSTSHGTTGQILKSNGNAAPTWIPQSDIVGDYLPLAGGTLTGNLAINGTNTLSVGGATTLSSTLTISGRATFPSAVANRPQLPGCFLGLNTGDGNFDIWGISTQYYPSHATAGNAWGLQWNGDTNQFRFVGNGQDVVTIDLDQGNFVTTGSITGTTATFSGLVSGITPTAAANFATKAYVDGIGAGVSKIIASTNITISPLSGLGDVTISATDTTYTSGNGITFTGTPATVINADINYISYSGTNNFIVYGTQNNEGTTIPTGSQIIYADASGTQIVSRGFVSDLPFTNNTGDLTSITVGNGLTGSSLTGPIPNILMSGSYTGTFTATSLASNSFLNNAGSLLFSAGNTTTGASRSLNLRHTSGDPSSSDDTNSTGITWGQRTDSQPYYIIYPQLENWSSSGNYSKLTLAWHTGIKIGANDAYGGTRFYDDAPDISGAAVILNVGVGNTNVGVVNNLTVGGDILVDNEIWLSRSNNDRNLRMTGLTGTDGGFAGFSSTGANLWQIYGSGSSYGFLNSNWGSWDLEKVKNSNLYMNNNTTYYLNTTSNSNFAGSLNIGSNLLVNGSAYQPASGGGYIGKPYGGDFYTTQNVYTGAIQVTLPTGGTGLDDMLKFVIDIFDYATQESVTVFVGGYTYQNVGSGNNTWYNVQAQVIGQSANQNYTVRFGDNGTSHCVWVGDTNSSWNHLQVIVRDFFVGYGANINNWIGAWDISVVTTQTTVNNTLTNNFPMSSGDIGGPYLPLTGGTLSGNLTINSGGSYPLRTSTTQRYNIQIRNPNNTVNSGYGWWWGTDTNFNMFFHADGASDRMTLTRLGELGVNFTAPGGYGQLTVGGTSALPILALRSSSGKVRQTFYEGGTGRFHLDTLSGSDGLAFVDGDGVTEVMRASEHKQLLINATSSGHGASNYGYNLGVRGIASQAFISICKSNQTLDTQGIIVGLDNNNAYFISRDNKPIDFYNNNTFKMRIATNGNVGILNSNPGALLDVGPTIQPQTTGIDVAAGAGGGNCIGLTTADNHNWFPYTDGNNYYSSNNHIFRSGTNNSPNYMKIDSGGNVGINQDSSISATLHVNGNIRWGGSNVAPYVYSAIDGTGLYIENVGSTAANSGIRLQCRNTNAGSYTSIKLDPSSSTIVANVAGTNRLLLGSDSYIYHNTGATTFNANGYIYTQSWINLGAGAGIYSSTNSAHFYPNNSGLYGTWRIDGSKGGYTGINMANSVSVVIGMFDTSGNGGTYDSTSNWHTYWHRTNGCLAIAGSGTSSTYSLYVHGAIYATSDIVAYSDRRSKENIITIDNALDKVSKIRGVYYTPKEGDDKSRKVGVIAQELNEILPEAVTYAEDIDQYGVDYGKITGLLIEAVKELQAKVKELENK